MKRGPEFAWTALRLALGALFLYASVYKIISPGSFAQEVNNYHLLPAILINPFAIVAPWVEFLCGLALVTNRLALGASTLVALMMTAFTAAVAWAVAKNINVSCGCFRAGGSAATWWTFARDVALLIAAGANLIRVWSKDSWNSPT